jgi:Protein of unknown function (DUF1153)
MERQFARVGIMQLDGKRRRGLVLALPLTNIQRWTPLRKAAVVRAVRKGVITEREAIERYCLSAEELAEWQHEIERHGTLGLRVRRRAPPR